MAKHKKLKQMKPVAYKDGTTAYENDLPYPIVLYPSFYGSFFAFKENENADKMFLCECSKKAVMNFVKIIHLSNEPLCNKEVAYHHQFSEVFLEYIEKSYSTTDYGYILIKYSDEYFKPCLCHLCNKAVPSYNYCLPMYGSQFTQQYGWYEKQKLLDLGIFRNYIYFPDMFPNVFNNNILQINHLPSDESSQNIIKAYTAKCTEASNFVRANFDVKLYGRTWTTESHLYDCVCAIWGSDDVRFHFRPDWLKGLELDIFVVSHNLGIEYQGIQHYKPLKHWGGEEGFVKRRANDIKKKNLCLNKGVTLVYFTYMDEITPELVYERLSEYIK
jgi:hypothetical protein